MNKEQRKQEMKKKLNKRLRDHNIEDDPDGVEHHNYRSHGAPCSCWACRGQKFLNNRGNSKRINDADQD